MHRSSKVTHLYPFLDVSKVLLADERAQVHLAVRLCLQLDDLAAAKNVSECVSVCCGRMNGKGPGKMKCARNTCF